MAQRLLLDKKFINFDTKAPVLGQILKVVIGLALVVAVKEGLKSPLMALFNGSEVATAVRYFAFVLFGGAIWPLTFPFFAKIGKKNQSEKA